MTGESNLRRSAKDGPPVLATPIEQRFAAGGGGPARPSLVVGDRVTVTRATVALDRTVEEWWQVPLDQEGGLAWDAVMRPRKATRLGRETSAGDGVPSRSAGSPRP